MFDIGFFEIVFIAIVALLVLGPEKMPHAVRMTAAWIGRFKRSFLEAKYEIERHVRLEEFKQRVETEKSKLEHSLTDINDQVHHNNPEQTQLPEQTDSAQTLNQEQETPKNNTAAMQSSEKIVPQTSQSNQSTEEKS